MLPRSLPATLLRPLRALSRAVLLTEHTALRHVWSAAHAAMARLLAVYLGRGVDGVSVHLAGSLARGEAVYGLSDLDLVAVVPGPDADVDAARSRLEARWRRLRRTLPAFDRLASLSVYGERRLAEERVGTCLTAGLATDPQRLERDGGYLRLPRPRDDLYRLIHPGLRPAGSSWKWLAGRRPQPAEEAPMPREHRRLAAWLELQWWWRYSFLVAMRPELHSAPYVCFKLVSEPARVWLWLLTASPAGRRDSIERTIALLPEEESVLRGALELRQRLGRAPAPPIRETLGWLVRCGSRIAALIEADIEGHGVTDVRLAGARTLAADRDGAPPPDPLPLVDWRARAFPPRADESLEMTAGDPADPATVAGAARAARDGLQPALRSGRLLVLPADPMDESVVLRAVQFPASDPVSFALAEGRSIARFPEVRGWSARDCARRAVAEHRNWLAHRDRQGEDRLALERLVTAARAALFLESVDEGAPRLPLTGADTLVALADRFPDARAAAEGAREALATGAGAGAGDRALLRSLSAAVGGMPAYKETAVASIGPVPA